MKSLIIKLLREGLLTEDSVDGKHLVIVDVQPAYQDGFSYWLDEFVDFLNTNYHRFSRITFLFNGPDLGFPEEHEYRMWWEENELDYDIINNSHFYDKGYAFFRSCMDMGGDEEGIVNLVKFMISKDINDSRDLDDGSFWDEFINIYGNDDIRELMEFSDDCISIPELMSELQHYNNIVLCGGGANECLKEVEIALDALDKPYNHIQRFVY